MDDTGRPHVTYTVMANYFYGMSSYPAQTFDEMQIAKKRAIQLVKDMGGGEITNQTEYIINFSNGGKVSVLFHLHTEMEKKCDSITCQPGKIS